jgi:hypothetical protein
VADCLDNCWDSGYSASQVSLKSRKPSQAKSSQCRITPGPQADG